MTQNRPTWGIVSTIRAPKDDILRFAAYHLDLGADYLYLFLDEPNRPAVRALRENPRIQVRVCNEAYWQRRGQARPDKHQVRQSTNATFIYRRTDLDWLTHIDVDEFLWSSGTVAGQLQNVPNDTLAIRVRPNEALAGDCDTYKAYIPTGTGRRALVDSIYPTYGGFVQGGFLSHVQGKVFVRKGLPNIQFRIHNLFQKNSALPVKTEVPGLDLCHRHAPDWDHWIAHYGFRLKKGSYQAGMAPNVPREKGGLNMHELLSWIEAEHGEAGLRDFYDEMSGTKPEVRQHLADHGMILHRALDLDQKVAKHFPGSI